MAESRTILHPAIGHSADTPGFDREVDARGLSCPLPILTTRKSLDSLRQGEILKVLSTDKGSPDFFRSLVRQTGLELLSWQEQSGEYRFFLRKP